MGCERLTYENFSISKEVALKKKGIGEKKRLGVKSSVGSVFGKHENISHIQIPYGFQLPNGPAIQGDGGTFLQ